MKAIEQQAFEGITHQRRSLKVFIAGMTGFSLGFSIIMLGFGLFAFGAVTGTMPFIMPLLLPTLFVGAFVTFMSMIFTVDGYNNKNNLSEFKKELQKEFPNISKLFVAGTLPQHEITFLNNIIMQKTVTADELKAYGKRSGLKELVFVMICTLPADTQKTLLEAALEPGTDLNTFFATKRGWFKTSTTSGMLGKIAEQLQAVRLIISSQKSETPSDYQRMFEELSRLKNANEHQGEVIIELGNMVADLTGRLDDEARLALTRKLPDVPTGSLIDLSMFPPVPTAIPSGQHSMYPALSEPL